MKNFIVLLAVFFLFTVTASAADLEINREGRSELGPLQRSGHVFVRGFTNIVSSPLEAYRTLRVEPKWHPKAWPVSYVPRTVFNFAIRLSSGAYDLVILPTFVAPFSDDIRPFTRVYDLPDYPWQLELNEA